MHLFILIVENTKPKSKLVTNLVLKKKTLFKNLESFIN